MTELQTDYSSLAGDRATLPPWLRPVFIAWRLDNAFLQNMVDAMQRNNLVSAEAGVLVKSTLARFDGLKAMEYFAELVMVVQTAWPEIFTPERRRGLVFFAITFAQVRLHDYLDGTDLPPLAILASSGYGVPDDFGEVAPDAPPQP